MSCSETLLSERRSKKPSNRPAIEIYRPPGLRSCDDTANTKPSQTAGAKQLKKDVVKKHSEENNNDATMGKCTNTLNGCTRRSTDESSSDVSMQRADSALSSESTTSSQASSTKSRGSRRLVADNMQSATRTTPTSTAKTGRGAGGTGVQTKVLKAPLKKTMANRNVPAQLRIDGLNNNITSLNSNGTPPPATKKESTGSRRKPQIGQQQQQQPPLQPLSGKEIDEIVQAFRKLSLNKENSLIEQFIASNFENEEMASAVGQMLVHFSIEENRSAGKAVARIASQLMETATAPIFHKGTIVALMHYFDCGDRLRIDHFRVWIAFLSFVSDLYASVGYVYEGELVALVFRIFNYMLKAPVLDTLKIEELESLIGCLLSVGYDLERQCPEQLAVLKDLVRDAFVEVQEPWARKMILLLMELGASGWKLPMEANEYYFQQTNS